LSGALTCLDFTATTGFAPTFSSTGTLNVYGNFSIMSTVVWSATGVLAFSTTTSQTITTNGVFIGSSISFSGLTTSSYNLASSLTSTSNTNSVLSSGTINLNNYVLYLNYFVCSGTSVRAINFGTGEIRLAGNGTQIFACSGSTNFTITGTNPTIYVTYTGAGSQTVTTGVNLGLQAAGNFGREINWRFLGGTYTISGFQSTGKSVNFTGFSGSWTKGTSTVPGDVTLSPTMTIGLSGFSTIFTASGTQTIITNGVEWGAPIFIGSVASGFAPTVVLGSALTIQSTASTKGITIGNGTLNLNGYTATMSPSGVFSINDAGGTQNITFNGGSIICTTGGFSYVAGTFTTTFGSAEGQIRMTQPATFDGGGKTYNCALNHAAGGQVVITGANTFTTIMNGSYSADFVFPASTTTTVTNWNVSGILGTLTFVRSSTVGTQATLSKIGGIASSNFLNIRDSNATGGAAWYAGANSTDSGNNTGWLFVDAPQNTGFLMLFR
jgi:hypothetical protein